MQVRAKAQNYFRECSDEVHVVLEKENIHVMSYAGCIRIAVHGYDTPEDIVNLPWVLDTMLRTLLKTINTITKLESVGKEFPTDQRLLFDMRDERKWRLPKLI